MGDAVRIELLGDLRVVGPGGHVIKLPASRKARGLLAYLVITGERQRRQHLCDLLWDGVEDPRAALRWSLSRLRSVLDGEDERFESDRLGVGIVAGAFEVDLFEASSRP